MLKRSDPVSDAVDVGYRDVGRLLAPGRERSQSLEGFDDEFVDIVDYIVRTTHRIWEERGIGRIYDHYLHNIVVHTSDGTVYGRDRVIADSVATMAAFPDVRLYADDVIWSGNDRDGFHTSHRITWVGHNTGHGIYGPPTGRKIMRTGIAHCLVRENRIVEEWIARDELALVRQLGHDEHVLARRMAERDAASRRSGDGGDGAGEVERLVGQSTPRPPADAGAGVEGLVRATVDEIWNWRLLNRIDERYAEGYVCYLPPSRRVYGRGALKFHVLSLLAAFPDAKVGLDHFCARGDEESGYRTALRWTFEGTHTGPGRFGEPTGRRVRLLGISHDEIHGEQFTRGWTIFDEFSLLKQLYRPE